MNKKNILCITYREWACKIYDMLDNSLPEYNFKIIRDKKSYSDQIIKEFKPDIILWYGWSWIIPENLVNEYDCICLHPSPLPKYRGGSPIQNQIINNETMSAVTIFKMNKQIDAGDIIRQLPMSLCGNIEDILDRMTQLGFSGTCDFLKNGYNFVEQDDDEMTYFSRRKPHQSEITLEDIATQSVEYIYNKIRMLRDPFPNAYIKDRHGKKLFITEAYYE
tara:strand:+ start:1305 stop:1964 length:660 start_codon:yes stop_codon:yes gene_type:complete